MKCGPAGGVCPGGQNVSDSIVSVSRVSRLEISPGIDACIKKSAAIRQIGGASASVAYVRPIRFGRSPPYIPDVADTGTSGAGASPQGLQNW